MCGSQTRDRLRLGNEYATIEVSLDHSANGPRLRVSSVREGTYILLDPMALALLCHADHSVFALLADEVSDHGALAEPRALPTLPAEPEQAHPRAHDRGASA